MEKQLTQMDIAELGDLSTLIDNDLHQIAEIIFPHQPAGYIDVTEKIGEWAITKKTVLEFLASDNQHIALLFEKICHRIWQTLPTYARYVKVDLYTNK